MLNQVLVRFEADATTTRTGAGDARTREVIAAVQRDGTCWLGGTTWAGRAAMRVSVSGWQTTEDDIDRSAAAILAVSMRLTTGERDGRGPDRRMDDRGPLVGGGSRSSAAEVGQLTGLVDIPVWRYVVNRAVTANTPWIRTPFRSVLMALPSPM